MLLKHNILIWLAAASPIADAGLLRRHSKDGDGVQITPLVTTTITKKHTPQTITNSGTLVVLTPAASVVTTVVPLSTSKLGSFDFAVSAGSVASASVKPASTKSLFPLPSSSGSARKNITLHSSSSRLSSPIGSSLHAIGTLFYNTSSTPASILSVAYSSLKFTFASTSVSTTTTSKSTTSHSQYTNSTNNTVSSSSVSPLPNPGYLPSKSAAGVAYVTVTEYTTAQPTTPTTIATFTRVPGVAYITATRYTTVGSSSSNSASKHASTTTTVVGGLQMSYSSVSSADIVNPVAGVTQNYTMPATSPASSSKTSSSSSVRLYPASVVSSYISLYPIPALWVATAQAVSGRTQYAKPTGANSYALPTEVFAYMSLTHADSAADHSSISLYDRAETPHNSPVVDGLLAIIPGLAKAEDHAITRTRTASSMSSAHSTTHIKSTFSGPSVHSSSNSWEWASGTPDHAWYTPKSLMKGRGAATFAHSKRVVTETPAFGAYLSANKIGSSQPPNHSFSIPSISTSANSPETTAATTDNGMYVGGWGQSGTATLSGYRKTTTTTKREHTTLYTKTRDRCWPYTQVGGWGECGTATASGHRTMGPNRVVTEKPDFAAYLSSDTHSASSQPPNPFYPVPSISTPSTYPKATTITPDNGMYTGGWGQSGSSTVSGHPTTILSTASHDASTNTLIVVEGKVETFDGQPTMVCTTITLQSLKNPVHAHTAVRKVRTSTKNSCWTYTQVGGWDQCGPSTASGRSATRRITETSLITRTLAASNTPAQPAPVTTSVEQQSAGLTGRYAGVATASNAITRLETRTKVSCEPYTNTGGWGSC